MYLNRRSRYNRPRMMKGTRQIGLLVGAIALVAISAACASRVAAPRPFPMPGSTSAAGSTPSDPSRRADASGADASVELVVRTAMALRGTPYRNGGADTRGFDCSGFTQYVFARGGFVLPRDTSAQFLVGSSVLAGEQRPGDLIFFATTGGGPSHVGIAVDGDRFVHAPSSRGAVRVESLSLPYWSRRLIGIRRVTI
jgi:cell wall-associated NlpC family hydrolase